MQLKRDTDYAVRILYCLNQNYDAADPAATKGLDLSEIAMQTGTPKVVAERVCERLENKGVICSNYDRQTVRKLYCPSEELLNYSLLDIIETVERSSQLFAVFDKRFAGYKNCAGQLQKIQKRTEKILSKATLGSLFKAQNRIL